ncbi:hypothetical protein GTQ34_06895 [Muricauda sp. JGD-17]|uniref:O-antigen ligase family protein n=1 Tax=Flagellimonas ochracea TaxID=2696472 RepID=A0A964TB58_9FLAO|nr:hypothetical protein [Allomuricauda ochracea]NAY91639.1 hypothetical protein [Allomuricauda ochracea]
MKQIIPALLIFQPFVNKLTILLNFPFDVYNEMITLVVFLMYLLQVSRRGTIRSIALVALTLLAYMCFVVVLKNLYPLSFLQVGLYGQWFVYFLYYHGLDAEEKRETLVRIKSLLDIVLGLILLITLFEIPFYKEFRDWLGLKTFGRGINGFYLVSFFGSGASLANFISFYVIIWFYFHYGIGFKIGKKDRIKLMVAFLILVLSFSRKEVLFMFLFLLFFPFAYRSTINKWAKKTITLIGVVSGLLIYYIVFFSKANTVALDDKYIRWRIVRKAVEILGDNMPWGTGVGTFGSKVSLMNTAIYEKYNIGPEMLGYKSLGQTRGPIYDAFLFTFTTEIGLGILIFLFFFFKLFDSKTESTNRYKEYIKNFMVIYIIGLSVFQPILLSSFGYLCAIFLGLSTGSISLLKFRTYAKN